MAREYRRREPSRHPKPLTLVVTEGESTEPGYFRTFKRTCDTELAALKIIPLGQDPRAVVEKAMQERTDRSVGTADSFWAVFDRDKHPRFDEAVNLAEGNDIRLAISDPCFELWCVLHYQQHDAPCTCDECAHVLRELSPEYRRPGKPFDDEETIRRNYHDAVQRAKELEGWRAKDGGRNPRTTVHHLTEHMRSQAIL